MAFTSLCEAVVSWRDIRHEGLLTKITRIMQMYKAKLVRRRASRPLCLMPCRGPFHAGCLCSRCNR